MLNNKTTYNLTKPGITKFTTDNIRLLTGDLMDLTKNFNNSKEDKTSQFLNIDSILIFVFSNSSS